MTFVMKEVSADKLERVLGHWGVFGGGALGLDGAFLLQWLHDALLAVMAGVIPGQ